MQKNIILFCILFHMIAYAQKSCTFENNCFKAGESFTYKIYYNWGALWMSAGEANFTAQLSTISNRSFYHFIGTGSTYSKYDWFFKVRDKYESYADTASLKPLRFIREVHEGGNFTYDDYVFTQRKNVVYASSQKNKNHTKLDSIAITSCTYDVMTAIFYARSLDFSAFKPNDTIPLTFVLDGVVYPSYMRYLGKETITTDLFGMVRCIKFKPKLIEGTLFKSGEFMTVWVTDDENKMPVYVETAIIVGTVKVYLNKYYGLRNKMDCLMTK